VTSIEELELSRHHQFGRSHVIRKSNAHAELRHARLEGSDTRVEMSMNVLNPNDSELSAQPATR
jgi:hypothetical protein